MLDLMPWKKRDPRDITRFRGELDNLFNRFYDLELPAAREFFRDDAFLPSLDVGEGKKEITVKAEIPGVEAKDIDVSLDGRTLTIKGEKKQEKEEKEENYHCIERSYGYFNRSIELPAEVDPSDIDASYKKGVLTVTLKKSKVSEGKKIEIKTTN